MKWDIYIISKYYHTDYLLITRQQVPLKCKDLADTRLCVCIMNSTLSLIWQTGIKYSYVLKDAVSSTHNLCSILTKNVKPESNHEETIIQSILEPSVEDNYTKLKNVCIKLKKN